MIKVIDLMVDAEKWLLNDMNGWDCEDIALIGEQIRECLRV